MNEILYDKLSKNNFPSCMPASKKAFVHFFQKLYTPMIPTL